MIPRAGSQSLGPPADRPGGDRVDGDPDGRSPALPRGYRAREGGHGVLHRDGAGGHGDLLPRADALRLGGRVRRWRCTGLQSRPSDVPARPLLFARDRGGGAICAALVRALHRLPLGTPDQPRRVLRAHHALCVRHDADGRRRGFDRRLSRTRVDEYPHLCAGGFRPAQAAKQ